jgi:hypothetical protein
MASKTNKSKILKIAKISAFVGIFGALAISSTPALINIAKPANTAAYSSTTQTKNTDNTTQTNTSQEQTTLKTPTPRAAATIENGTFSSTSGSGTKPLTPSSWTKIAGKGTTLDGVIKTNDADFSKGEYELGTNNPSTPGLNLGDETTEFNVLMINSKDASNGATAGYKSTDITLTADSFYEISFWAKTIALNSDDDIGGANKQANFSAYLIDNDAKLDENGKEDENKPEISASFTNDSTNGGWDVYTFYVKTNDVTAANLSLELWLGERSDSNSVGSKGAVFFDRITATELGEDEFLQTSSNDKTNQIATFSSLLGKVDKSTEGFNFGFENNNSGKLIPDGFIESEENEGNAQVNVQDASIPFTYITDENTSEQVVLNNNKSANNDKSLLINTDGKEGYVSLEADQTFKIKQQGTYLFSFWAKTNAENIANANLEVVKYVDYNEAGELVEVNKTGLDAQIADGSNIATAPITVGSDDFYNNWSKYTFVVKGHAIYDAEIKLHLNLGTKTEKAIGYAAFDDIKIMQINETERAAAVAASAVAFNLSTLTDPSLANGFFNNLTQIEWEETDEGKIQPPISPYTPTFDDIMKKYKIKLPAEFVSDYTHTADEVDLLPANNAIKFGVVDINPYEFSQAGLGTAPKDFGSVPDHGIITNNVLFMQNKNSTFQSYASPTVSLASGTYTRIDFKAYGDFTGTASVELVNSNGEVVDKLLLYSANTWDDYSFYLKGGMFDQTLNLKLNLGESEENTAKGRVFFDNILSNELTEDAFNNYNDDKTDSRKIAKTDFSVDSLNKGEKISDKLRYLYKQSAFEAETSTDNTFGIYSLNDIETPEDYRNLTPANKDWQNVLMLKQDNLSSSILTYANTLTFATENYYKISVYLRTEDLTFENDDLGTVDNPIGLSIEFDGLSGNNKFKGIKGTNNKENGFVEYAFYIKETTATDVSLKINIGSENHQSQGNVYINALEFTTIDADTFEKEAKPENETDSKKIVSISNAVDSTPAPEPETPTTDDGSNFDWVYIPTAILAIALLFVLVKVTVDNVRNKRKQLQLIDGQPIKIKKPKKEHGKLYKKIAAIISGDEEVARERRAKKAKKISAKNAKRNSKLKELVKEIIVHDKEKDEN